LHGSALWSPVRDEEAAGSNPVTPTIPAGRWPAGMLFPARGVPLPSDRHRGLEGTKRNMREQKGKTGPSSTGRRTPGL